MMDKALALHLLQTSQTHSGYISSLRIMHSPIIFDELEEMQGPQIHVIYELHRRACMVGGLCQRAHGFQIHGYTE